MPIRMSSSRVLIYAVLIVFALFFIGPTYLVVLTSFKTLDDLRQGNLLGFPAVWSGAGWAKAWGTACTGVACSGLKPYFFNSVKIVVPSVVLSSAGSG